MYKKYTTPCPHIGCGAVERHLEMAQPTKKQKMDIHVQLWRTHIIYVGGGFNHP